MKIGIIVYSETNNTYSVAKKLEEKLISLKNEVRLEKIETNKNKTILTAIPAIDVFDLLVFASPVQAFTLAIPMKKYLSQIKSLEGKRVIFFVTQSFSKSFLGGNRAIRYINNQIIKKGGEPFALGIVHWGAKNREEQINNLISSMDI